MSTDQLNVGWIEQASALNKKKKKNKLEKTYGFHSYRFKILTKSFNHKLTNKPYNLSDVFMEWNHTNKYKNECLKHNVHIYTIFNACCLCKTNQSVDCVELRTHKHTYKTHFGIYMHWLEIFFWFVYFAKYNRQIILYEGFMHRLIHYWRDWRNVNIFVTQYTKNHNLAGTELIHLIYFRFVTVIVVNAKPKRLIFNIWWELMKWIVCIKLSRNEQILSTSCNLNNSSIRLNIDIV